MAASQVFSGARAVFKIGVDVVGYAASINGTAAIQYQPIQSLGNLAVSEHTPVAYTVEMGAQLSRLVGITRLAANNGFAYPIGSPDNSKGTNTPQIMPAFGDDGLGILQSGELSASIQDTVTNTNIYTVSGLKCSQKGWEISAGGAVAENCQFVARIMNDNGESATAIGDFV